MLRPISIECIRIAYRFIEGMANIEEHLDHLHFQTVEEGRLIGEEIKQCNKTVELEVVVLNTC